jgi:hypothetical protein
VLVYRLTSQVTRRRDREPYAWPRVWAPLLLGIGGAVALAIAAPASAASFEGPWDSAHEPPRVTTAGITARVPNESEEAAEEGVVWRISIAPSVFCPTERLVPLTVTFSNPNGAEATTAVATMPSPIEGPLAGLRPFAEREADPCLGGETWGWSNSPSGEPLIGGKVVGEAGRFGLGSDADASVDLKVSALLLTTPYLYQVTGPGGVISQGTFTVEPGGTERRETGTREETDLTECKREHRDIHSGPLGQLYCLVPVYGSSRELSISEGWPKPESERRSRPKPGTEDAITPKNAPRLVKGILEHEFVVSASWLRANHFRAFDCKYTPKRWVRCKVSLRDTTEIFDGYLELVINHKTGVLSDRIAMVRTNLRTHKKHTFRSHS